MSELELTPRATRDTSPATGPQASKSTTARPSREGEEADGLAPRHESTQPSPSGTMSRIAQVIDAVPDAFLDEDVIQSLQQLQVIRADGANDGLVQRLPQPRETHADAAHDGPVQSLAQPQTPSSAAFTDDEIASWHSPPGWTLPPLFDLFVDPQIRALYAPRASGGPERAPKSARAINRPIPKVFHQLDLGSKNPAFSASRAAWREYSADFGYDHRTWQDADIDAFSASLPPANQALLAAARARRDEREIENLLAISILARLGGIWASARLLPPTHRGEHIDIAALAPMRGLVVVSQDKSRYLDGTSLWASTELVMATPHHPNLCHMEATAPANSAAWSEHYAPHPVYTSGSIFFSRAIAGAFTVIPARFLARYGMHIPDDLEPPESTLDGRDAL